MRRIGGQGAGQADALALAAAQLGRIAAGHAAPMSRPTSAKQLAAARGRGAPPASPAGAGRPRRCRRGEVREQSGVLHHVAHAAAQRDRVEAAMSLAVDQHPAALGSSRRLISFSVVVLPQPDGPSSARVVPRATRRRGRAQRHVPVRVHLADAVELDHRIHVPPARIAQTTDGPGCTGLRGCVFIAPDVWLS